LAALASCSTVDPRSEIRNTPPCPVTLAIDGFGTLPAVPVSGDGMYMTIDDQQLCQLLSKSLRDIRAASRVVLLSELTDKDQADIVLKPRLKDSVQFTCEGWANSWWASGGLWLVTWIGGMAVNDSTYQSNMALDCTFEFPRSSNRVEHPAASSAVD